MVNWREASQPLDLTTGHGSETSGFVTERLGF